MANFERPPSEWTNEEKEVWIQENEKIIHGAIQSYRSIYEYDDLWQMAMEAVLKAFNSFDNSRKVKLTTYAYRAIRNEINMRVRSDKAQKRNATIVPLGPVDTPDGKQNAGYENQDTSESDWLHTPQPAIESQMERQEAVRYLQKLIRTKLTDDEREVFQRLLDGETQVTVAQAVGCSQAKISNMQKLIRMKLIYEMRIAGFDFR